MLGIKRQARFTGSMCRLRLPKVFFFGAVILGTLLVAKPPNIVQRRVAIPASSLGLQGDPARIRCSDERLQGWLRFDRNTVGVIHDAPVRKQNRVKATVRNAGGELLLRIFLHYRHA